MIVYLDGKYLDEKEAFIPFMDRGFLFGDGVYTTLQVNQGRIFFLEEHLRRLEEQCRSLTLIPSKIDKAEIKELVLRNEATEGIWKLKIVVTGGELPDQRLPERKYGHLLFFMHPFELPPYASLQMGIYATPIMTAHSSFKSLSSINRFYVMEDARRRNCDDALTQTESGILLEASFGNLFWSNGEQLFTPDPKLPIYFGVTITNVLRAAKNLKMDTNYVKAQLADIPDDAQVFRTNSMGGVRPIVKIEERIFSRNLEFENRLLAEYKKLCELQSFLCLKKDLLLV